MVDESTKKTLSNIPLLQTKAGPRDKDLWVQRLKEEYQALIKVKSFIKLQNLLQDYARHLHMDSLIFCFC